MNSIYWFIKYQDCLASHNIKYKNQAIAIAAPLLPFDENKLFLIKSIPDNMTIYHGTINGYNDAIKVLSGAKFNAKETYEIMYDTPVSYTSVDPFNLTIFGVVNK